MITGPPCPKCGTPVQPDWDWCHACGWDPEGLRPEDAVLSGVPASSPPAAAPPPPAPPTATSSSAPPPPVAPRAPEPAGGEVVHLPPVPPPPPDPDNPYDLPYASADDDDVESVPGGSSKPEPPGRPPIAPPAPASEPAAARSGSTLSGRSAPDPDERPGSKAMSGRKDLIELPREQVSAYVVVGVVVLCSLVLMWVLDRKRSDEAAVAPLTAVVTTLPGTPSSLAPSAVPTTGPTVPPSHPGGPWQTHTEPAGKYSVDMPGVAVTQRDPANPGDSAATLGDAGSGWYVADFHVDDSGTPTKTFDQAYTEAARDLQETVGRMAGGTTAVTPGADTTLLGMQARSFTVTVNRAAGDPVVIEAVVGTDGANVVVLAAGGGPFADFATFVASAAVLR